MAAISTPDALLQNLISQIENKEYLDASIAQRDELIKEIKASSQELSDYVQGHFKVSQSPTGDGSKTTQILSNLKQLSGSLTLAPALDRLAQDLRAQQKINSFCRLYMC